MPDISVHNEDILVKQLTDDIQPLAPDMKVIIVVDHNYSE